MIAGSTSRCKFTRACPGEDLRKKTTDFTKLKKFLRWVWSTTILVRRSCTTLNTGVYRGGPLCKLTIWKLYIFLKLKHFLKLYNNSVSKIVRFSLRVSYYLISWHKGKYFPLQQLPYHIHPPDSSRNWCRTVNTSILYLHDNLYKLKLFLKVIPPYRDRSQLFDVEHDSPL